MGNGSYNITEVRLNDFYGWLTWKFLTNEDKKLLFVYGYWD